MACARLQKRTPLLVDVRVLGLSMRGRNGLGLPRCAVVVHGRLGCESLEAIAVRLHLRGKTVSNWQTPVSQKLGVVTAVGPLQYAQRHRVLTP